MSGMGNAIMGTGQASGEDRALRAAEDALRNPLLGEVCMCVWFKRRPMHNPNIECDLPNRTHSCQRR